MLRQPQTCLEDIKPVRQLLSGGERECHTQHMCNSSSQHMIVQLTYTGASGQPYIHYIHPLKLTESSTESMGPYGVTSDLPRSQD